MTAEPFPSESFVQQIEDAYEGCAGLDGQVHVLTELRELRSQLAGLERRFEGEIADGIPDGPMAVQLPGRGEVTVVRGWARAKEKWDHALAADAVVQDAMDRGENPKDAILACAGISYWRKGAL